MFILSIVIVILVALNASALITYRAFTTVKQLGWIRYSDGPFYLSPEGVAVSLFGVFLIHVRPTAFWNAIAYLFFPIEYSSHSIPGMLPFTDWFSRHQSVPTDILYLVLAILGLPFKFIWSIWLIFFRNVLWSLLAFGMKKASLN